MIKISPYTKLLSLVASVFLALVPTVSFATVAANGTTCDVVRQDGACMVSQNGVEVNIGPSQSTTLTGGSSLDNQTIDASSPKIWGCNPTQTKIPNIGTFIATAPTYVPVYDDAVTINTGYLVFKTCVLDAIAAKIKTASLAKITADTVKYIQKGNNGEPLYVNNYATDRAMITNRNTIEFYKKYNTNSISPLFRTQVVNASIVDYQAGIGGQKQPYAGTFTDPAQQQAFLHGNLINAGGWDALLTMGTNPSNSPLFATINLNEARDASNAQVAADRNTQLIIGNGYPGTECLQQIDTGIDGEKANVYNICLPGATIAATLGQALGSGVDLQKMAQNYDSLVDYTYTGIQERAISSPQGLGSLTDPSANTSSSGSTGSGSGLSYLDQMFQSILSLIQNNGSSGPTTPTGSTSGLTALIAALATEQQYLAYDQQIQAYLGTQTSNLNSTQDACWITLASAVASLAASTPYTVATSTTNAVTANNSLIAPVNTFIQQDVDHSTTTIAVLQTMIASTASTTSTTANQAILDQLAALSANGTLHTAAQLAIAKQNVTDIQTNIGAKVDATIAIWKQGTGWCNASSTTVVQSWLNMWKR